MHILLNWDYRFVSVYSNGYKLQLICSSCDFLFLFKTMFEEVLYLLRWHPTQEGCITRNRTSWWWVHVSQSDFLWVMSILKTRRSIWVCIILYYFLVHYTINLYYYILLLISFFLLFCQVLHSEFKPSNVERA